MAGTMQFRCQLDGVLDGEPWIGGGYSLGTPFKSVATTGRFEVLQKHVLAPWTGSPLPSPTVIFDAAEAAYNYQFLSVHLVGGSGFAWLAGEIDRPVSASNLAPVGGGTYRDMIKAGLSCWTPYIINTPLNLVHATAARRYELDGNGFPAILTDAGTVEGRLYKLWARNASDSTPAVLLVCGRD